MFNRTLKFILFFAAAASGSFVFYAQGVKLEEKEALIIQKQTDSLKILNAFKDSMIAFLKRNPPENAQPPLPETTKLIHSISNIIDSTAHHLPWVKPQIHPGQVTQSSGLAPAVLINTIDSFYYQSTTELLNICSLKHLVMQNQDSTAELHHLQTIYLTFYQNINTASKLLEVYLRSKSTEIDDKTRNLERNFLHKRYFQAVIKNSSIQKMNTLFQADLYNPETRVQLMALFNNVCSIQYLLESIEDADF